MYKTIILILALVTICIQSTVLQRELNKEARIFGGKLTQPHEYPFAVFALIIAANDDDFVCGGALISNKHVLTTAQYFYNAVWARISLGFFDYNDERTDVIFTSDDLGQFLTVHEQFNPETLQNNIAILQLKESIQFTEKIESIAFLPIGISTSMLKDLTTTIIGWGNSEESQQISSPRHANVTMLPPVICKHYYSSQDTSSTFCSDGAFATGACAYDEGGPLIATSADGSRVLVGLISLFGSLGCNSGWPTVYVNITSHLDWINKHTDFNNQQLILI